MSDGSYQVPAPSESELALTRAVVRAVVEERMLAAPDGKVSVPLWELARVLYELESYRDDAARLHCDKMELLYPNEARATSERLPSLREDQKPPSPTKEIRR